MKYLYVTSNELGNLTPTTNTIGDFLHGNHRIYYTKLDLGTNQIQFDFILKTYNFTTLLANITEDEIPLFMLWRSTYFPGIRTHVNIYETRDKEQALYLLEADMDLQTTVYFYKRGDHALDVILE